jgi:hypothetical protein
VVPQELVSHEDGSAPTVTEVWSSSASTCDVQGVDGRATGTFKQALDDGTYWMSRTHHVRAGRAVFSVGTRRTRGMTFVLNPRWANVTNAVTNVVTRYAQTKPGQLISNDVARHKKRATACWAGTTRARIVMKVRVVKFSARALGGGPGHAIRAWFKPMRSSLPPMSHTWRGTLGNQDAYYCSA